MTVCLLIIDPQVDFHEGGSLAVNGATADSERIAKFIRDNLVKIDDIVVTLDSHLPHHIAHAKGWKDSSGQPPAVFSQITAQQIKDGIWIPANLDREYCLRYTESLEKKGKFLLTIWPEHCIIGTNGHNVFPPLQEALEEWTSTSTRAWSSVMKSQNIRTEMYSALEAEIPDETDSNTYLNVSLLEKLRSFDQILICGQALSHCVNHTTRDLLRHFTTEEKGKIVVFRDGCSSVYGCDAQGEEFLSFVQSEGGRVMKIAEVFI